MNRALWWLAGGLGAAGVIGVVLGLKGAYDAGAFGPGGGDGGYLPPTGRSPQDVLNAVARVNLENEPTVQKGYLGQQNWCNRAAYLICTELGVPLVYGEYGTRANDQIKWLDAGNAGWFQCSSQSNAQELALQGYVVLATYFNMNPFGGSGHLAVVLPIPGPMRIAQSGATGPRSNISLAAGFGAIRPVFYAHS